MAEARQIRPDACRSEIWHRDRMIAQINVEGRFEHVIPNPSGYPHCPGHPNSSGHSSQFGYPNRAGHPDRAALSAREPGTSIKGTVIQGP